MAEYYAHTADNGHPCPSDGLKQTIARMRSDAERKNFCKCVEPLSEFLRRLAPEGLRLPDIPDWDFWVWNSDYDEDLGLGHISREAFNQ